MRLTVIGLVALGLLAAVCAAVLVAALRVQKAPQIAGEGEIEMVEIVVAVKPLPAMTVVDAASVEVRSMPVNELPRGAFRSAAGVIGKVLIAPIGEGQPFSQTAFARDGSGVHLASVLKDGYRAMSVSLQDFSGLDGLLYPGSMVDVIASFRMAQEAEDGSVRGGDVISTVLLEAIQVLAIEEQTIVSGQLKEGPEVEAARTNRNRRVVTLLVDPRQAEALQLASGHGTIALALRNPMDMAVVDRRGTSFLDLSPTFGHRMIAVAGGDAAELPLVPAPPTPPAEPEAEPVVPSWETTILRGSNSAKQSFDLPEGVEPNSALTRRRSQPDPATTPPE